MKRSLSQVAKEKTSAWYARNRSLALRQSPVWAKTIGVTLVSLCSIGFLFSILFKIDEVVTVSGQLVATSGNKDVNIPIGGVVESLYFKDGMFVKKGTLLIKFDTRQALLEKITVERQLNSEKESLRTKLKGLEQAKSVLLRKRQTLKIITSDIKNLVESGGFQRMQYLQQLDQLYELDAKITSLDTERHQQTIDYSKTTAELTKRLTEAELQLQYQSVKAPTSGIIFDPNVSPSSTVQPAQRLLTIVPQDSMSAVVYVPNKDIGLIKKNLTTKVRVDAFPYSKYGELEGKIVLIEADAMPPTQIRSFYHFPVTIKLSSNHLSYNRKSVPLSNGMTVTANLKLREKPVISILSDLLVSQFDAVENIRQ